MNILVTGSSGFVGSALVPALRAKGHVVRRLVRGDSALTPDAAFWNPEAGLIDPKALSGIEGVIHLAGENVSAGRWTAKEKEKILTSRIKGTTELVQAMSRADHPPRVMLSASAIGYYGSHGDQWLDESSLPGTDFLADVCREWEKAAEPVMSHGTRLVLPRIGIVLNKEGGALKKMLLPFRLGLGGPIGDGRSYMSWIARTDMVGALIHLLETDHISGPVNCAAPNPVPNAEFTKTLAQVLHRPAFFRIPKFVLRAVFGEMADQTILSSMRVTSEKLSRSGFNFRYSELAAAIAAELS